MVLSSLNVIGYYNLLSIKKSVYNILGNLRSDNSDAHENVTEK